jgi:hypothetical protein
VGRRASWAVAVAACGIAAGCGSLRSSELPPAAGPAVSPALSAAPAGRLVEIGGEPEGIVADGVTGLAAVALRKPARIALVDVRGGAVRRRLRMPGAARHVRLAAPGGPVLVPAEPSGRLARVALPEGDGSFVPTGNRAHDVARARGRDFVADELGTSVAVFEGGREVGQLRAALQPSGVATADRGRKVAVLSARARQLDVFDAATLRGVGVAAAGTGPTHVVSDGGNYVYVADTKAGALLVFRIAPELRLTRRYPLPGSPYGLAFDSERGRIWATLTATNELVELSAGARPRVLRRFPSVRQPNSVAVESRSGRVVVAGRADGVLQLLDPPPLPRRR